MNMIKKLRYSADPIRQVVISFINSPRILFWIPEVWICRKRINIVMNELKYSCDISWIFNVFFFFTSLCCRFWLMEIWTMSGWAMIGCPVWVCPSTEATSWSHWWTPACWTIWPRKSCVGSWKWWTVSTGIFCLRLPICYMLPHTSLYLLFVILNLIPSCANQLLSQCRCVSQGLS